jgi:hypothetical protein
LGRIPIDPVLSYSEDMGVALWNMASSKKAASAVSLENVANELLKQLARLAGEN